MVTTEKLITAQVLPNENLIATIFPTLMGFPHYLRIFKPGKELKFP